MEIQSSGFTQAVTLHRQGRLNEAIPLYQAFLRANRKHIGAANLLGVALMQAGRQEEAADAIAQALRIDPKQASAHYNLGTILQRLNRHDTAADHFRKAIALKPDDAQAHNNLGAALKALGRIQESAVAYSRAAVIDPQFAQAYANLATVQCMLKQYDESIVSAERALALAPDLAEAHVAIGNALVAYGKIPEALQVFDQAIRLQPDRQEAYFCAGNAMMTIDLEDRAIEHFRQVIRIDPQATAARFRLAVCLYVLRSYDDAAEEAKKAFDALKTIHRDIEAEISAGMYLQKINRNTEALAHFEKALAIDPDSHSALEGYVTTAGMFGYSRKAIELYGQLVAREPQKEKRIQHSYNMALIHLGMGDLHQGWKIYESRFAGENPMVAPRLYATPRWKGEDLQGPLLVWGEQGLGDQIIYGSMIEDAAKRAQVVVDVDPRLVPLFARSFPQVRVRPLADEPNEGGLRAQVPAGGLGEFFRGGWQDFPRKPYLIADGERAERLRDAVRDGEKCIVGISWRSANPKFGEHKTAKLEDFSPVLSRPELGFVDLQYGDTAEEIETAGAKSGVRVRHLDEIDNTKDIDGLAALIEACDAVVTVSNTTAHIAGALGKRVWILVPHGRARIWYWFKDRDDSPWYPGARIVRQEPGQSWENLVASIAPEVAAFAKERKAKG